MKNLRYKYANMCIYLLRSNDYASLLELNDIREGLEADWLLNTDFTVKDLNSLTDVELALQQIKNDNVEFIVEDVWDNGKLSFRIIIFEKEILEQEVAV